MKTTEIAAKLGYSISHVNHLIFCSLKNKLHYDSSRQWKVND